MDKPFSIGPVHFRKRILKSSGPGSFDQSQCDILFNGGYGGIVCKTCTWQAREGNPEPNDIRHEGQRFNCYGLPNLGYTYYECLAEHYYLTCAEIPFVLSLSAHNKTELKLMLDSYSAKLATGKVLPLVEINVSCPNTGGLRIPGYHVSDMREILELLKADCMYGLKLPPYLEREKIGCMARLFVTYPCIRYIVCSNSVPNCLPVKQSLSATYGGMSGGANRFISMSNCRQFQECFAEAGANIVVIGCGGIESVSDALDYLGPSVNCVAVQTHSFLSSL
jgi:dihydroorotate dehydrogenase